MKTTLLMNARRAQPQPCQQQQGAAFINPPKPSDSPSRTILGGSTASNNFEAEPATRVPVSNDRVMSWIRRASGQDDLDPYTYLNLARNKHHLDQYDDNLAAAERYFEGLQGNYNEHLMAGHGALKSLREINVGGIRPGEKLG